VFDCTIGALIFEFFFLGFLVLARVETALRVAVAIFDSFGVDVGVGIGIGIDMGIGDVVGVAMEGVV
jgi:hypothetical protein